MINFSIWGHKINSVSSNCLQIPHIIVRNRISPIQHLHNICGAVDVQSPSEVLCCDQGRLTAATLGGPLPLLKTLASVYTLQPGSDQCAQLCQTDPYKWKMCLLFILAAVTLLAVLADVALRNAVNLTQHEGYTMTFHTQQSNWTDITQKAWETLNNYIGVLYPYQRTLFCVELTRKYSNACKKCC